MQMQIVRRLRRGRAWIAQFLGEYPIYTLAPLGEAEQVENYELFGRFEGEAQEQLAAPTWNGSEQVARYKRSPLLQGAPHAHGVHQHVRRPHTQHAHGTTHARAGDGQT